MCGWICWRNVLGFIGGYVLGFLYETLRFIKAIRDISYQIARFTKLWMGHVSEATAWATKLGSMISMLMMPCRKPDTHTHPDLSILLYLYIHIQYKIVNMIYTCNVAMQVHERKIISAPHRSQGPRVDSSSGFGPSKEQTFVEIRVRPRIAADIQPPLRSNRWICKLQKSHAMKYAGLSMFWVCGDSSGFGVWTRSTSSAMHVYPRQKHMPGNFCSFGLLGQQVASLLDGVPARCNPFHHTKGVWLKVLPPTTHFPPENGCLRGICNSGITWGCQSHAAFRDEETWNSMAWAVERLNSWRAALPDWWSSPNTDFLYFV